MKTCSVCGQTQARYKVWLMQIFDDRKGSCQTGSMEFAVSKLFVAIANFRIAYHVAMGWWKPEQGQGKAWVTYGLAMMVMEMIILSSTLFLMDYFVKRSGIAASKFALVSSVYVLFAVVIALAFENRQLFFDFAILLFTRGLLFLSSSAAELEMLLQHFVWAMILYFILVFITTFVSIPPLGITDGVKKSLNLKGTGLWVDHPERALCALVFYFIILGFLEISTLFYLFQ